MVGALVTMLEESIYAIEYIESLHPKGLSKAMYLWRRY
jgi:hypothetical protein